MDTSSRVQLRNKRGVANRAEDAPRARRAGAYRPGARADDHRQQQQPGIPGREKDDDHDQDGKSIRVCVPSVAGLATAIPTPAEAQHQSGLVNVAVGDIETGDILSNNNVVVGAAAEIAANVCGIAVNPAVLSLQLVGGGTFKCENQQKGKFVQITK